MDGKYHGTMSWDKKKLLHERHHFYSFINNDVEPVWEMQARQAREMERWILTKDPAATKTAAASQEGPAEKPFPIRLPAKEGDPAEKPTPTKKAKPNTQP
jgi:hypothetical protein